jgi:hypothetical protein
MDKYERARLWILETAVEVRPQLALISCPDVEMSLNKEGHGLTIDELVPVVYEMVQSQLILLCGDREHPMPATSTSRDDVAQILSGSAPREPVYEMSATGGEIWERAAHPRWENFVSVRGSYHSGRAGVGVWTIEGNTKESVQSVCEKYAYAASECPVWTTLVPWHATYWKLLPEGYRADIDVIDIDAAPEDYDDTWYTPVSDM